MRVPVRGRLPVRLPAQARPARFEPLRRRLQELEVAVREEVRLAEPLEADVAALERTVASLLATDRRGEAGEPD